MLLSYPGYASQHAVKIGIGVGMPGSGKSTIVGHMLDTVIDKKGIENVNIVAVTDLHDWDTQIENKFYNVIICDDAVTNTDSRRFQTAHNVSLTHWIYLIRHVVAAKKGTKRGLIILILLTQSLGAIEKRIREQAHWYLYKTADIGTAQKDFLNLIGHNKDVSDKMDIATRNLLYSQFAKLNEACIITRDRRVFWLDHKGLPINDIGNIIKIKAKQTEAIINPPELDATAEYLAVYLTGDNINLKKSGLPSYVSKYYPNLHPKAKDTLINKIKGFYPLAVSGLLDTGSDQLSKAAKRFKGKFGPKA